MNDWTSEIPDEVGHYWFYGNPYMGGMGIDFREDSPPVEAKMHLVEVYAISNGLMAVTEGQVIPLRKFVKTNMREGVVGYWKRARLPVAPKDRERLFAEGGRDVDERDKEVGPRDIGRLG